MPKDQTLIGVPPNELAELTRKASLYDAMVKREVRIEPRLHGGFCVIVDGKRIADGDTYQEAVHAFIAWAERQEA